MQVLRDRDVNIIAYLPMQYCTNMGMPSNHPRYLMFSEKPTANCFCGIPHVQWISPKPKHPAGKQLVSCATSTTPAPNRHWHWHWGWSRIVGYILATMTKQGNEYWCQPPVYMFQPPAGGCYTADSIWIHLLVSVLTRFFVTINQGEPPMFNRLVAVCRSLSPPILIITATLAVRMFLFLLAILSCQPAYEPSLTIYTGSWYWLITKTQPAMLGPRLLANHPRLLITFPHMLLLILPIIDA